MFLRTVHRHATNALMVMRSMMILSRAWLGQL
jgi:hypothetical protein